MINIIGLLNDYDRFERRFRMMKPEKQSELVMKIAKFKIRYDYKRNLTNIFLDLDESVRYNTILKFIEAKHNKPKEQDIIYDLIDLDCELKDFMENWEEQKPDPSTDDFIAGSFDVIRLELNRLEHLFESKSKAIMKFCDKHGIPYTDLKLEKD